ncbi:MAG: cyclic nucleotide-binding domain-containing protein [Verrucomicrobiota bacterium]
MIVGALEALRRVPLLADLDPEELQPLADRMYECTFAAGETATTEGEPGDGFYIVESGEAEVTVQGQRQGTLAAGDVFGEIALLTGSGRAATITATSDLHCFGLAPLDFRTVVEGNPSIAWRLVQSMMHTLS